MKANGRPALRAIAVVPSAAVSPCAACGHDRGWLRQIGVALCFKCAGVLRASCLRKVRISNVGDAIRAGARPDAVYRCKFCRGLHIARMLENEEPMKAPYVQRLNQVCVVLAAAGAIGPQINRNRLNLT